MNNDAALILLLADRQREIEALREEVRRLTEETRQLAEALSEAREPAAG